MNEKQGDDVKVLHQGLQIETLKEDLKERKRIARRALAVTGVLALVLLAVMGAALYFITKAQHDATMMVENNRMTILDALFSVVRTSTTEITSRDKRIEAYFKIAKKIILEKNPTTDLTDAEINETLRVNFQLSEYYMWSPYRYLSYWSQESDFTKGKDNKDGSGAKGSVQFMSPTMKLVLQELYEPGMEYDPVWSCKAWYKYMATLSQAVNNDEIWIACAWLSPEAIKWRNQKKTPEQFMKWIVATYPGNDIKFPWKIKALFDQYSAM